ncbi:MAG: ABC transporter permease [Ilumatobacteraceae bacterium]
MAWLVCFFVVPVYAVMAVALGGTDPVLHHRAGLEPAHLGHHGDARRAGAGVRRRPRQGVLPHLLVHRSPSRDASRSVTRSPTSWRSRRPHGGLVLAALVLPFWISYLMRMLAWTNLLQPDGYVNRVLGWFGLMDEPRNWLDGAWPTVVIGLVYGYVPFFILPLYSSLERIDGRLIEAGRDLGASRLRTFLAVTLPLSVPGLLAASVITILPMAGDYYTNAYLTSGSPRTEMVGNQIVFYLQESSRPQIGASLVLVLMVMLFVLMVYYLWSTPPATAEMDR